MLTSVCNVYLVIGRFYVVEKDAADIVDVESSYFHFAAALFRREYVVVSSRLFMARIFLLLKSASVSRRLPSTLQYTVFQSREFDK